MSFTTLVPRTAMLWCTSVAATLTRVLEGPFVPDELPASPAAEGFWFVGRAAARGWERGVVSRCWREMSEQRTRGSRSSK